MEVRSAVVFALAAAAVSAVSANAPRLSVGMKAPALTGARRIKGRIPSFSDGKLHIVEFWATWCAPCRMCIPQLSEIAEKYPGKLDVIGVSVWEHSARKGYDAAPYLQEFVKRQGTRMAYNVAADRPDGVVAKRWLTAAGTNILPTDFIVDARGRIAWIGISTDLDVALTAVFAHSKSPARAVSAAQAGHKATMERLKDAAKRGDLNTVMALRKQLPDSESMDVAFNLLREKNPLAAKIFVQSIMRDPSAGMWQFLDLAWCLINPSVKSSLSDDDLGVQLVRIAELRADPSHESHLACLEYLVSAYLKSNDLADAARAEQSAIKIMEGDKTKDYAGELKTARKSLEAYRAGRRG